MTFENVGRGKSGWTIEMIDPTPGQIVRSIKHRHELASNEIDFEPVQMNGQPNTETFAIIVGGFRDVGRLHVCPPSEVLRLLI